MGACGSAEADPTVKSAGSEPKKEAAPVSEQKVVAAKPTDPEDKYETIKLLGEGASCKVACVKDKTSGKLYAMKIITHQPEFQTMYEVEVRILSLLKHPNVVEMHEYFEDKQKKSWRILTGMCRGGELFDRVKNGSFSEKAAARLTREMLSAVAYCHTVNVVHRDIKPENFVMDTPAADSHMKLIDFGCAKEVKDDELVKDFAGSPYYVAPEVLTDYKRTGATWKAADIWSVGVIIYLLVTGYPPFNGRTQDEIFDAIRQQPVRWPRASEIPLSKGVKDIISKMLIKDPTKRISAAQALRHPWVAGEEAPETPLPESVTKSLGNFQNQCKLKKVVGKVIANRLTEDDKASLAAVFKQFDKNGDGQLGPDEIAAMMKHIGGTDSDWKEFMSKFDEDGSGGISQDEFAAATVAGKLGDQTEQELKKNFEMFDVDRDGYVSAKEIEKLCAGMDPSASKVLIGEVDKNGDGKIGLDEWIAAMRGQQETRKKAAADASAAPSASS